MACEILLRRGQVAFVDDADWPLVGLRGWYARPRTGGGGFYAASTDSSRTLMHRLLLGCPKGLQVDHRDGDGLNNRRSNLRIATAAQNIANSRPQVGRSSRFKGVSRYGGRWRAYITSRGRRCDLGYYASEEKAAEVYDRAAFYRWGDFARLNLPGPGGLLDVAEYPLHGPDDAVLTKKEVATFLKLGSTRALDRLIEKGFFPRGRKRGKQITWTGADLAAYLQLEGRYFPGALTEDEKIIDEEADG